jgi:hypothetical protein
MALPKVRTAPDKTAEENDECGMTMPDSTAEAEPAGIVMIEWGGEQ